MVTHLIGWYRDLIADAINANDLDKIAEYAEKLAQAAKDAKEKGLIVI